jgi:hypothetical protein
MTHTEEWKFFRSYCCGLLNAADVRLDLKVIFLSSNFWSIRGLCSERIDRKIL